jgi:transposase
MRKTFKFRLYPTKSQVKSLENTLEICKHIYNRTLELRKDAWKNEKKSISLYDTNKFLKVWSIEFPQNKTVYSHKAVDAGRKCILVDPRNTSKKCSRCGTLVEKDLNVRVHSCPICGLEIDRDLNAAINILALGLKSMDESSKSSRIYSGE